MALGATQKQILYLFAARVLAAAFVGVGMGVTAALFLTRLLRSQLYGVQPDHFLTFAGAALVLIVPTLLASVLPAAKAGSVNLNLTRVISSA